MISILKIEGCKMRLTQLAYMRNCLLKGFYYENMLIS